MAIDGNPLWNQRRYTEAIIWTNARIVQELVNKFVWMSPDKTFADRIYRAYRRWVRDQNQAAEIAEEEVEE